jgi:hypothetical protein
MARTQKQTMKKLTFSSPISPIKKASIMPAKHVFYLWN